MNDLFKPQMQPCSGRNCGSTNPNLHSAECFEDYEKSTGMAQPEQKPVAWKYKTNFYMSDKDDGMRLTYSLGVAEVNAQSGSIKPLYTAPPQRKPLTSQERDAQRWRFLMENSYDSESVTQFHVWEHSWEPHSQTGEPTEWKQRVRGIALIDFIDRAIEAAHGIKE